MFKFEMNIGDIISIFALIATFITILQVKKQRSDMNKPYMVIDFDGNYNHVYTIEKCVDETDNNYFEDTGDNVFDFNIKNIGNGIAKDVRLYLEIPKVELLNDEHIEKMIMDLSIKIKK